MAFDPNAATARYIDSLGATALQKAHHYTVGTEWTLLWGLAVAAVVTWIIVRSRLLDQLNARLGEGRANIRAFVVSAVYIVVAALLTLPWTLYTDWWRPRSYDLSSQPLGDFLVQSLIMLGLTALIGGVFLTGIYALIRRTGRGWWIWSGGLTAIGIAFLVLFEPMFIEPLFNTYEPVPAGPVRNALVGMAAKAHIPPNRIFMYNGSRQSNHFTANVNGVGSSARVAISDVALKNASLDEVRAVTGHEIGHYVLGHVWYDVAIFTLLAVIFFFLADRLYPAFARAFGADRSIAALTGVPVLVFMVTLFELLALPITNTVTRTKEAQADLYSLRTENRPDALASSLVKTAAYRYPRPNPVEEFLFYDHPSVERRVRTAMEWKAAHPEPPAE